jgi:hypothetical protein
VAAGDVDGDGWTDLYFCALDRPNALYRNLGNGRFTEMAREAGVDCPDQSSTGAVLTDVDGDGDLDLLVNGLRRGTRLFLNDGHGKFREATAEAGLTGTGGATSMALADVDGDGFLDLYVVNYRSVTFRDEPDKRYRVDTKNNHYELLAVDGRPVTDPELVGRFSIDPVSGVMENGEADILYHNDGHGHFVPLSWTNGAFLDEDGRPAKVPFDWGLSAMFRDINQDGFPDLYVCNDFQSEDRVWINDGKGHFRAIPHTTLRHTSLFSMGVDFADLDRDGRDDFFVADMLSRDHSRRQVQLADRKVIQLPGPGGAGRPQYSQNTLFWNRGDGTYAEIAAFSGVEASEWSWCPLFLDADLDGFEDLFITTGHGRDAQNIDIARRIEAAKRGRKISWAEQLELRRLFPILASPVQVFRNRGDLTFEVKGEDWGFHTAQVAQGMCLADLDNDGDLDLVVNSLNGPALIFRNDSERPRIAVRLKGLPPNIQGIGARVIIRGGAVPLQSQEILSGGRYLSGDEPVRTFAAGSLTNRLTIEIQWRSGRRSVLRDVAANKLYEIDEAAAGSVAASPAAPDQIPLLADVSELINHRHVDQSFDDFERQPLLPRKLSQLGPGISWCDIDGDGWEDLLIPSGKGGTLAVYKNTGTGNFAAWPAPPINALHDDQTTVLGWHENETNRTLLLGTANYEQGATNATSARRLDPLSSVVLHSLGAGFPSAGPLAMADVDGDGDLDLFIGGRVVPGRFPDAVPSRFFRNEKDSLQYEAEASESFAKAGMVSGAVWSDLDGDGFPELILACDGGPVRVYRRHGTRFVEVTESLGFGSLTGWWNSVAAGDFDGDGRMDLVAGNWGLNSSCRASLKQPFHRYYGDPEDDGTVKLIDAEWDGPLRKIVPRVPWEMLAASFPFLRERYDSFTAFSSAGVADFLGNRLAKMKDQPVTTLESMVFLNRGDHFAATPLPREGQFAPVFGIGVGDLDGDGHMDLVVSQGFFDGPPDSPRYDAGQGLVFRGNGKGGFVALNPKESGLSVDGEGRGVALADFDHDGRIDIAMAQNSGRTRIYRNVGAVPGMRIKFQGPPENPDGTGAVVRVSGPDKAMGPAVESHAGSGYWSQDSSVPVVAEPNGSSTVTVRWPGGRIGTTQVPAGAREVSISWSGTVRPGSGPAAQ